MSIESGNDLERALRGNLASRLATSEFDLMAETDAMLQEIGASTVDSGGKLSFYGNDPIVPSVIRFGGASAIALAAKAVQIAAIWRMRTGESQDIHVDVRKALRRFSPFIDREWETVNGYDGGMYSDPENPVFSTMYETGDGRWVMPTNPYPALHRRTTMLLGVPSDEASVAAAIKKWKGEDLEQAGVEAGIVMPLARSLGDILHMDVFRSGLRNRPLISVEKIADGEPVPFDKGGDTPLSGIRALGLAHVIAGASIGRALALHGADVLNVWNPQDWEHDVFYFTAHVGMRSTKLRISDMEALDRFMGLMAGADIFFSNRRAHYLEKHGLDAETLCAKNPGLVHTQVIFCNDAGPWSNRVGFDVSTGLAFGIDGLEGTDEKPEFPPIRVINDYIAGWLATVGTLEALKRRATEGGSYKVVVSLSRVTLWLMSLGIFDKQYAQMIAGSSDDHFYVPPDQFTASTPLGTYRGVTEQVLMSKTPGSYRFVLEPRGAAQPIWL